VARSLYSEKEIFIRELVSNASDALEKLRYTQSNNASTLVDQALPLEIRLRCDDAAKTFSIHDSGIGMTKEEAIENLGTIAHSGNSSSFSSFLDWPGAQPLGSGLAGSKSFLEKLKGLKEGGGENIIGQFGVGFYSAFMVGNKVTVRTRSALGASGIEWTSDG